MTVLTFFVIMLDKINTNEKLKIKVKVIVKEYQHKSTVKGFHAYKEIQNPVKGSESSQKFWTLEWNWKILQVSTQPS